MTRNSHTTKDGNVLNIAVAAFGRAGNKNFYALLDELGIPTARASDSYMRFSRPRAAHRHRRGVEHAGLVAQNF